MSGLLPKKIQPLNRHLLIVPNFSSRKKENAGVLLPEGYSPPKERYIMASILDISRDCSEHIRSLKLRTPEIPAIVVDRSMIEEIKIFDKIYYMILENHVVGVVRGFNEG